MEKVDEATLQPRLNFMKKAFDFLESDFAKFPEQHVKVTLKGIKLLDIVS